MIDLVIVSDGKTQELRDVTQNCIDSFHRTCEGNVICVEKTTFRYNGATIIRQDEPFNYNGCLNKGFDLCSTNYVCFSNNDVKFIYGWAKIIEYGYESMSPLSPGWFRHEGLTGTIEGYNIGLELCGWCIVAKKEMIQRIGGFPEDVDFWCSDNLYADVLRYYGVSHALVTDCKVEHRPSTTLFRSKNVAELTQGQVAKYNEARLKWI